jgi:hypothetical protein
MEIVPTLAFAAHAGARWALVNEKLPEYFREVRPETATDYEPVPPGLYTATLEKIEEATSAHGTYYRWQFDIEDEGEQENRRVFANVSDKFGPQSKARRWCEQMIGRAIRKGEQFDTDALLGQSYHIMVSNTPEDERGRVYDNVENVHAIRSKVNPKPQKVEETDDAEKGFDGIPW